MSHRMLDSRAGHGAVPVVALAAVLWLLGITATVRDRASARVLRTDLDRRVGR
jgi:hypothetical protein